MEQYHQYLFRVVASEAYQDADGNWQNPDGTSVEYVSKCRFERDGKGTMIGVGNGKQVAITGTIYTPAVPELMNTGQQVIVSADRICDEILEKLSVVSADNGRLHNRIYVQ